MVDHTRPWGYFDGAAQGDPPSCKSGACLYISNLHFFFIKASLGAGTNNYVEL